jgi:hypothetical protein
MGLNITKMLTPTKAPFYSIVQDNAATPLGSVVLPVTFGTKDNYRTVWEGKKKKNVGKMHICKTEAVIP